MFATMEADIKKGKVLPLEPDKLPQSGRALLVILNQHNIRRVWSKVRKQFGWLKTGIDPAKWQRLERDTWQIR